LAERTNPGKQRVASGETPDWMEAHMLFHYIALVAIITFFAFGARADDPAIHGTRGHGWYENAELTPAAKLKFGIEKCCAKAEVIRTQFRVNRTTADDEWWWLDKTTSQWRRIDPEIIHYGEHAPDKQPTLFVWNGKTVCFFVPEEGI
jgi:hypothetical protein